LTSRAPELNNVQATVVLLHNMLRPGHMVQPCASVGY
jgi:hypothetical protein